MSTKRSVPFEFFAQNQFIYFDIGRIAAVERETGMPIINIISQIEESICGVGFILAACRAGLSHHYSNKPGVMEDILDNYLESGGKLFTVELLGAINRALLASGLFGKDIANKAVKNEIESIPVDDAEEAEEKNAKKPVKK